MKVLHIAPKETYNDYWGYQNNLITHYHKMLGHDVTLIVSTRMYENGKLVNGECADYVLNNGVRVIRLNFKKYHHKAITETIAKIDVYDLICDIKPDFIFFHGGSSDTVYDIVKYKKKVNKDCIIVQDNHSDFNNTTYNPKKITHRIISLYGKLRVMMTRKYISKYFGVTPCRCDYLIDHLGAPKDKVELLVMGGDDEKIRFDKASEIRAYIRKQHNIDADDFLIVTGGKIDSKKNTHLLMEAVTGFENKKIKLIVFGQVSDDIKEEISHQAKGENIRYIGWIDSGKVYDYFLAADLAVFPGLHSVLWEQACACGLPGVFRDLDGMHHVDVGGNCMFLKNSSVEEIGKTIIDIVNDKDKYDSMKKAAIEKAVDMFSYRNIARRSLNV